MKKTVVANWGHAQQGKSDTVKRTAKLILSHYSGAITDPVQIDFSIDIKVIITIGKVKIGIESIGDPGSRIFTSLIEFANANCDIIICSTRTSGATVNAVSALHASHGYDIVWATNCRSHEKPQDVLNQFSAKHIFEIIQEIIASRL